MTVSTQACNFAVSPFSIVCPTHPLSLSPPSLAPTRRIGQPLPKESSTTITRQGGQTLRQTLGRSEMI